MTSVIVDTGPLVALINRRERHHVWAREVLDTIEPPLFTCDAVLSEACSLLQNVDGGSDAVVLCATLVPHLLEKPGLGVHVV